MATGNDLPVDADGLCMCCKQTPSVEDTLTCKTCVTPWHVPCLSVPPPTMSDAAIWECPDCSLIDSKPVSVPTANAGLLGAIRMIEDDSSLTDQEKAKRRQQLMSGVNSSESPPIGVSQGRSEMLDLLDEKLYCTICMQLPDRPVTTPCGHNFCLKCFQKCVAQGKQTCANCRSSIPQKMAREPRINSALVMAIRTAKLMSSNASGGTPKVVQFIHNQNRPDKAFITERAKKAGKANACSGKIFVTIPHDHFGPILPENDPERNQGVLVGETWEDRMECRQWGAHFPHVAGIAGQSDVGAQSVALSGGYEDDEDHGEWFLYTGSGGRDLSGNKRTNKLQSFEQKFEKSNEALRVSCRKGYPVRVVRSHKEKHSSYAPEKGVRYDGVYRIEQCWRKAGKQGFLMCRYLFVRCDNEAAPWTSDTVGDRPRPLPVIKELKDAVNITQRKDVPAWDFDEEKDCWMWKKSPPESRLQNDDEGNHSRKVKRHKQLSAKEKLLKEFSCHICRKVMVMPLTTPCAHNFCKACLEGAFSGQSFITQRTCEGRRTLRAQKTVMKCPSCQVDVSDFVKNAQVNRELMNIIKSMQLKIEEENMELGKEIDDGVIADNKDETCVEGKLDKLAVDKENCNANIVAREEVKKTNEDIPEKSLEKRKKTRSCIATLEEVKKTNEDILEKSSEKRKKTRSCIATLEEVKKTNEDFSEKRKKTRSCIVTLEVKKTNEDIPEKSPEKRKKTRSCIATLDGGAKTPSKKARTVTFSDA